MRQDGLRRIALTQPRPRPRLDDKAKTLDSDAPLLALRLGNLSHALEPGRDYLLGNADNCDLQIADAEPMHVWMSIAPGKATAIDISKKSGLLHNEEKVAIAELQPGDRLGVAGEVIVVIADDGTSALMAIPEERQAAKIRKVRVRATALRQHPGSTFAEMMAAEMQRAPWLMISVVLHVCLLLIIWCLLPTERFGSKNVAALDFVATAGNPRSSEPPELPKVVTEPESNEFIADPELPLQLQELPAAILDGPEPKDQQLTENPILLRRKRPSTGGAGGSTTVKGEQGTSSGNFQKQLEDLKVRGLEIVFVFDSTGSMTRTIIDTKSTIVQMLDVLRTLIPDARIGLVTYRDRGSQEEYQVREVPLNIDHWRATNFMQFVTAHGGGDTPEDVHAGLSSAFNQDWRRDARRVVVLAGDAPAHNRDFAKILKKVRQFAKNRRSYVHTLITTPDSAGEETQEQFEKIAKAGQGTCERIRNKDRILQRVLTLAFGAQFENDIQAVIAKVEKERSRIDVKSLHLVRMSGDSLRLALQENPVPTTLWNALVRRPRRSTATTLINILTDEGTPSHTRHATAAALQHILKLPEPPIDIESDKPLSSQRVARLRSLARFLPK